MPSLPKPGSSLAGLHLRSGPIMRFRLVEDNARRIVAVAGPVGDAPEAGESVCECSMRDRSLPPVSGSSATTRSPDRRVHDAVDDDGRDFMINSEPLGPAIASACQIAD